MEISLNAIKKMKFLAVEACAVWCYKRRGGAKNRGWAFPDGTACKGLPQPARYENSLHNSGVYNFHIFPSAIE
jgi:hypothetical protein